MKTNAEVSKDGTLTVNTFRDLKHFLDRVRYKHFQIPDDKPIKKLIIKDSKIDWTVNYMKELLRRTVLQTVENFEIISPDNRFCTIDGLLYSFRQRRESLSLPDRQKRNPYHSRRYKNDIC